MAQHSICTFCVVAAGSAVTAGVCAQPSVTGDQRLWHTVTLSFTGPASGEQATPNPFTDYRLDVTFEHVGSGETFIVPGFFAADGDAADTGATAGDQWRVHFMPDRTGQWRWTASFRMGAGVAVAASGAGTPTAFDGATGVIDIAPSDKAAPDFRARGRLDAAGQRYLRFAGDGTRFIKTGADSPENFLGYADFDGGRGGPHTYSPHLADWSAGDPEWGGGRGHGIIGAVNYLASEGVNSIYFLTMNAYGDGGDAYPWVDFPSSSEPQKGEDVSRFDVSKLEQWDIVFSHMTASGVMMHVVTQEQENDQYLDGGALGPQRRLYYRELIARFAHHPALVWNLGEENTNTDAQRAAFADFFEQHDPYGHPVVVHTFPAAQAQVYTPLLGNPDFDGASLQGGIGSTHGDALYWIDQSIAAGRTWFVCQDEIGPADIGVTPDAGYPGFDGPSNHDEVREDVLWGNLMAGGAGVEWYFGYGNVHDDLNCEDFRSRDRWWDYSRFAREFFEAHVPYWRMRHADDLLAAAEAYALAERNAAGEAIGPVLLHLGAGFSGGTVDLTGSPANYEGRWFNPRDGSLSATVVPVSGGTVATIPAPPMPGVDWALLLTAGDPADCDGNGVPDADEIQADPSLDCNGNGTLDACEPDCDGNGVPDDCDVAAGAADCDGNGVPDSCDIASGVLEDCDANGVPDVCETMKDCNANGVPDACERIADGLLGAYFENASLTGEPRFRIDPDLDFDWGSGAPFADFSADYFSAEWVGTITTPGESGDYKFLLRTNDGARMWIGGDLVIDEWYDQLGEHEVTVPLSARTMYMIRVEHYEGERSAALQLRWELPSGLLETVPESAFTPPAPSCCAADLNGDGTADVHDLLTYLTWFFDADPLAERTGDDPAQIDVYDLLVLLDDWFGGCAD